MALALSEHFTYKKLLAFTAPSILMMIFTSIYYVVDGFFVSNYAGETQFAAVNFIMPFIIIFGSIGFMFGSGGSALISKTFGEGDKEKANSLFSLFVYTIFVSGVVLAVIGIVFIDKIALLLGSDENMLEFCVIYGRIILAVLPLNMLQYAFQTFFSTAEKPMLGFIVTLIAGCSNMVLDWLFIAVFKWSVAGAAAATAISQAAGGLIPLIYFFLPNKSSLRLGKTHVDFRALFKASSNGISEFLSNVAAAVVGMLYNAQLMKYAGQDGVSAYGVLMYVAMIFCAIFIGYSMGTAPIIGYHYGAENHGEVKDILKKSLIIIGITSVAMVGLALGLAYPLSMIFVGYNTNLVELTLRAFYFYSFEFLFAGIGIFGSSFFTALNDGVTSALISFLRTMFFQVVTVLIFPLLWGVDGIWISMTFADFASAIVAITCLLVKRKKYQY